MIATITSKGQITIPLALREKLKLKAGDQLEFDESSPILTARRVVNRSEWENAITEWQSSAEEQLAGHPWQGTSSAGMIDDMRGGPADSPHSES